MREKERVNDMCACVGDRFSSKIFGSRPIFRKLSKTKKSSRRLRLSKMLFEAQTLGIHYNKLTMDLLIRF